ncbi:amino acid ABC transporter substrate-binding protein, PAAT family (TC 3.A.1.3.-) [Pseudomonas duriflava]|uniref:Amino acid ABC transporter substrate-binding protein, PAAT family (TC 3.A.1.3.-) n=1 Tax=Pseudomonas duriflava TaxID=459528 RepID=A0A562QIN2_9PSED|nr:ABC transporter substrate-binding protein [Pseudomonas duriflava]TWI56612.1 amino acid ABC transporter substrate-binding protein, PAAT family (TC 3.A.1.3.-) [Pseudomonas duriflava]
MSKPLMALLASALLLTGGPVRAESSTSYSMALLTENFPPYNMSVDGKNYAQEADLSGIAVEIVREMYTRAGIAYTMTLRFPWERIYNTALNQPNYGVFVTARLPERESLFKWVGPIGPDDWILLAKGDSPVQVNSLDDAKRQGLRIGAYKGDAIAENLTAKGLELELSLRDQENAEKLQSGSIDVWATGDPAGRYLARQQGITRLKTVLRFQTSELFLALNKETPDDVVKRLQDALDQMRKDGAVERITASYQ